LITISGETGSGKSVSRKLLTKNICDLGRQLQAKKKTKMHSRILKVDSIITAFGHAASPTNTNATCFIPYFEFQFNPSGSIVGMKTIDYLLDRSRVTGAEDGGRAFHIFHDLFEDLAPQDKNELGLTDPAHFTYTSGSLGVLGPSDRGGILAELTDDMNSLGIGKRETAAIFRLIATILHLGNIFFINNSRLGEAADVKNVQKLEQVADLLGLSPAVLKNVLTYQIKKIGRDFVAKNLDADGACKQRDALARCLYAGLFSWIIEKINEKLCMPESQWTNFISILDIPGIGGHSAQNNGLQRLLINYANERLLNSTLENLASGWTEKCSSQGIYTNTGRLVFNRQVLELLTSPRYGILSIIDADSARGRNSSDICKNIIDHNEDSSVFLDQTPTKDNVFGIKHYSGVIEYDCNKFLDSNSDVLQGDFVTLIRGSPEHSGTNNAFLRSIFSDRLISTTTSNLDSSVVVAAKTTDRFPSMKRKKSVTEQTQGSSSFSIASQVIFFGFDA
jgi:chitin synthase